MRNLSFKIEVSIAIYKRHFIAGKAVVKVAPVSSTGQAAFRYR